MIVTCASCLTKFKLDDSRIPAKGTKVRCSRCQHVFMVTPPAPESFDSKEEVVEDFETFAKRHEELMKPPPKEEEFEILPPSKIAPPKGKAKEVLPEELEEEPASFEKRIPSFEAEVREEVKPRKPARMAQRHKRRAPPRSLLLLLILVLLVFGAFYFWSELGPGGKLYPYVEIPIQKATNYWNQLWGEKEGLTLRTDPVEFDVKLRGLPVLIITGKVNNGSRYTRKHIRIRVVIFDQNRNKLAEREALCGRVLSRQELENQPIAFYRGDMIIPPESAKERMVPPGNASPFMIIFKDEGLSAQAKEYKADILEAPKL